MQVIKKKKDKIVSVIVLYVFFSVLKKINRFNVRDWYSVSNLLFLL